MFWGQNYALIGLGIARDSTMVKENQQTTQRSGLKLTDLMEMQERERSKPKHRRIARQYLHWRRILDVLLYPARVVSKHLDVLVRAKYLVVMTAGCFFAAAALVVLGLPTLALMPALLGFGLSMAALVYGAFPQLSSRLDKFPRHVSLATWALGTAIFTFVGFSSTLVVFLVLFIGGFTVANVIWNLLPRIIELFNPLPRGKAKGVSEATASPTPLLLTFGIIAAWSVVASLIMVRTGIHENRPLGTAFLGAHIGLLLGLAPMEYQMLREIRRPTAARWSMFKPSRLARHVLFAMAISALVGYEATLASEGRVLAGIPIFAIALVLASYLGVLLRQPFSFGDRLKPYHALVLPSFGMLLLFSPLVVFLSSPPVAITRLYGAAQAAGLLLGTALIVIKTVWRERAHRIRMRLQKTVQDKLPMAPEKEKEPDPYLRIRPGGRESTSKHVQVRELRSDDRESRD